MRKRGGFSPLFIVIPKPPLLAVVIVSCHFCHLG
ncbi:rfbP protein [Vibrio cholerae]|uniref:RfbP protein n=2 Tax=Vibrio TaxID=662 RepID=A0A2K2UQD5_VIBCL|nr:rfbP protein [Vibrio cholerae]RBM70690.1 rfbP protein [Vibrio paracholerae]EGQ9319258.1 rfbP protein [Vibrio cholerae]EGQ9322904.1 rfbP protein [Vibrio cholerae]EGQ9330832.1 rfbP protein [Vibrio cholerae]